MCENEMGRIGRGRAGASCFRGSAALPAHQGRPPSRPPSRPPRDYDKLTLRMLSERYSSISLLSMSNFARRTLLAVSRPRLVVAPPPPPLPLPLPLPPFSLLLPALLLSPPLCSVWYFSASSQPLETNDTRLRIKLHTERRGERGSW